MRVVLVDDDDERAAFLATALRDAGHDVAARLSAGDDLLAAVRRVGADVVLVDMDNPARDMLENCAVVSRHEPRPIVLFTRESDPDTIQRAVTAGVTAYIVDGMAPHRLKPILDVAIARFREHQKMREELDETRLKLADRRDIDRAKAIIMRSRQLGEDEAYALLRKSAMARRVTLGEAARTVLAAADLLGGQSEETK